MVLPLQDLEEVVVPEVSALEILFYKELQLVLQFEVVEPEEVLTQIEVMVEIAV